MFFLHLVNGAIDVHRTPMYSPQKLQQHNRKNLVRAVREAAANVPYYRDLFWDKDIDVEDFHGPEDLKKLPVLTKDDIREAFPHDIVADGTNIEACHYSATTGSTGKSLPFLYSRKTFAYYLATNLRVYTMIGYKPWYKCSYIKYTAMDPVNIGPLFRFKHVPSVMAVDHQIEMLREQKPDFIDGYASIIYEIAKKMTPEDLKIIRPKMILVNSEMSTLHQREFISSVFNCPVYDEYSTEETWMVASQCRHHNYHLFTDNVYVEFLDPDGNDVPPGEPGEMVLTTLNSPVMPFIRYKIGDIGRLSTKTCACGSPFPVLEAFEGRADESFIMPDGTYVSSLKILNTFTMYIKKYLHLIEEFKVIQLAPDLVQIDLVKGKVYKAEQFKELTNDLLDIMDHQVTITINPVDYIALNGSIKRKAIESRVSSLQMHKEAS